MIAAMATDVRHRCMVADLLTLIRREHDVVAPMVKAFASESVIRHTSNAIQILAGQLHGRVPLEQYYRRESGPSGG
jgi:alkylation response protein AidB-like acyl-CoA dehydrogenase